MGKPSKPNFPAPPSFQAFPTVAPDITFLSELGRSLSTGAFLPGRSGPVDLSFLQPLVTTNPAATKQAVDLASRGTIEARDRAQRDIVNQLEASNQLTSSVAVNRLSDLNQSFASDIADINTQFYLADVERSLANTMSLFGAGPQIVGQSVGLGQNQQAQQNEFALQRYDRELSLEAERFDRQLAHERAMASLLGPGIGSIYGLAQGNPQAANAAIDTNINRAASVFGMASGFGGFGQQPTAAPGVNTTLNQRLLSSRGTPGTGVGSTRLR